MQLAEAIFVVQNTAPPTQTAGADALVVSVLRRFAIKFPRRTHKSVRIARSQNAQQARLERTRADYKIVSQRFASSETLKKQGTISNFDYLERLRELKGNRGRRFSIAERELEELAAEAEAMAKQRTSVISAALSRIQEAIERGGNLRSGSASRFTRRRRTSLQISRSTAPADGAGRETFCVHDRRLCRSRVDAYGDCPLR